MKRHFVFIAALLVGFSCVSGPSAAQKAPAWVLETPPADASYTYFVGDSSDPSGDQARAVDQAVGVVISNIVKYMGVKINAEFVGETQATLDDYSASMRQKITETSQARIAGFSVMEKFFSKPRDKKSKAVNAYVLARYETKELAKERDRIRKLIEEQENQVLAPERAGNEALASGRAADAVQSFLQAAAGAAGIDVDNKQVKIERNLNNARNALGPLRIVRVSSPASVPLGQSAPEPFVARVAYGEGDAAPGVPGAKLAVSYQRKTASGRPATKTVGMVSDEKGLVSFTPPAFDYVGASAVTMALDLSSALDLLDRVPKGFDAFKDSISKEVSSKFVDIGFSIGSAAKDQPVQVAVYDLDEAGNAIGTLSQSSAIDGLLREKFKATAAAPAAKAAVLSDDDAAVGSQAKALGAKRLIFGTAKVESVSKDGSAFVATCRVSLKALDADTGTVLASSDKVATAVGSSEAEARSSAYREAGKLGVKDLMAKM